jgi:hypothetical protein
MPAIRTLLASATLAVALAACSASDATAPAAGEAALGRNSGSPSSPSTPSTSAAVASVKCELRTGSGARSKISVDGKNLTPRNGDWTARVTSGGNTATAPVTRGVGDEVEFDFDSAPDDIAAGATAIARTFIVVSASAHDVTARIMDAAGNVVATGGADCRMR